MSEDPKGDLITVTFTASRADCCDVAAHLKLKAREQQAAAEAFRRLGNLLHTQYLLARCAALDDFADQLFRSVSDDPLFLELADHAADQKHNFKKWL